MTLYMCFIQTLVIACTVSEILARIDQKGPNGTFLTLKLTFNMSQNEPNLTFVTLTMALDVFHQLRLFTDRNSHLHNPSSKLKIVGPLQRYFAVSKSHGAHDYLNQSQLHDLITYTFFVFCILSYI